MSELTLFAGLARNTDPETSRLAAAAQGKGVEAAVLVEHQRAPHGLTDEELCNRLFRSHGPTVISARSRLKNRNLLTDSGQQRLSLRGHPMIVWRLGS